MREAVRAEQRVAVIGSGVAGLTAAHVLQRGQWAVTLFEADDRPGGHAHTHRLPSGVDGSGTALVDSGFIVHNRRTYPHLLRLFDELDVRTRPTEMSLSVRCDGCGLEYAGTRGLDGLLPGLRTPRRVAYLRMLAEVPRFNRLANAFLDAAPGEGQPFPGTGEPTLGHFVRAVRLSPYFIAHYLVPLVSAVWSCPPGTALDYPARYLFAFLRNHGMLALRGSPRWRTVEGGSGAYVRRAVDRLSEVRLRARVEALRRVGDGVELRTRGATQEYFAAAVVATHPDQALSLLDRPTRAQKDVLGAFRYSRNRVLLHSDARVMPRDRRAWASWNHRLSSCVPDGNPVRVSYHMNRLQGLAGDREYFVTLNSEDAGVDPSAIATSLVYEHPVHTRESRAAQLRLHECDDGPLVFAGAYHGWGFHEDGCASGAVAAGKLGVRW